MRKLVYFVAASIDGYIAAPDGSWEFFGAPDASLAFMAEQFPETLPTHLRAALGVDAPNRVFDTVLMGRNTYEPALQAGITSPYAHLDQIVFSRTLAASSDVRIVADDPLPFAEKLKQQPGADIWLAGGGNLAGQLLPAVDELVIKLNPVLAGGGIPLAAAGFQPHRFTPAGTTALTDGVQVMRYRAA
ncbi:dihydrofolate reductase family protein [Actinoplanes xinjiangensis]|uniref:Dihydrofolate reductase n=1 Tax=Actinoplanes xinjiangensis TaxID=512350 RepID=A0A316FJ29_9ACTN|nr:dihydrofolate reductase family protein [Actinoplanes xinjiangensis]PWK48135.1 dihydrofolate reductase [Actinoplanes xinjiangensis]GIF39112.1 deaminase [Actinoplanes xinjiangensis]